MTGLQGEVLEYDSLGLRPENTNNCTTLVPFGCGFIK